MKRTAGVRCAESDESKSRPGKKKETKENEDKKYKDKTKLGVVGVTEAKERKKGGRGSRIQGNMASAKRRRPSPCCRGDGSRRTKRLCRQQRPAGSNDAISCSSFSHTHTPIERRILLCCIALLEAMNFAHSTRTKRPVLRSSSEFAREQAREKAALALSPLGERLSR